MTNSRRALIFTETGSSLNHLDDPLKEAHLKPLLPHELARNADRISIIIVERPAANALAICSNLRKQETFKNVVLLVLLDSAEPDHIAKLSELRADLFFKPVNARALNRYLQTNVPDDEELQAETKSDGPSAGDEMPPTLRNDVEPPETEILPPPSPRLEDVIPTSNRMFPAIALSHQIAKGGVRCGRCGRWTARREDAFCSKCGHILANLVGPEKVIFEPYGFQRVGQLIELKNIGQNSLTLHFAIVADAELARRFDLHTAKASLEGGQAQHLRVIFDAYELDLTSGYQAALEIVSNSQGYSKQTVALVVERLPIPRFIADESTNYVLGVENVWEFRLANDGGGSLTLLSLRLTGLESSTSTELVELELLGQVHVMGGESVIVPVRVPTLDLTPGTRVKKIHCEFEQTDSLETDLIIEVIRPARLAVQPTELDFGVVSVHRSGKLSLDFVNGGGEELVIDEVTSSLDFLEVAVRTPLTIFPGNTRAVDVQVRGDTDLEGVVTGDIVIRSNSYRTRDFVVPVFVKFVEPAPYPAYVGIDFGTTASCVAVLDQNDEAVVIPLDSVTPGSQSDPRIMPSVLFFQPDGSVIAGREAVHVADINPANAVTSIKRVLGARQKKNLAGREFDPTELTSKIIDQLMLRTEKALFELGEYKTPRRAIVTVPVEVFDNQRRALVDACKLSGLEMQSSSKHGVVIDEAHAAALYYLSKKEVDDVIDTGPERLLIFDFGGGTLDCVLIEIEAVDDKMRLTTLAPFGDPRLGGDDIDWALVSVLADKAKASFPDFDSNCLGSEQKFNHYYRTPEVVRAAYTTRAHFKRQAELAKITLANANAVELGIGPLLRVGATPIDQYIMNGAGPARFEVTLNQAELTTAIKPFIERAASVVETICERAEVAPEDVHTILHVGRTSLLPMVRSIINDLLPNASDRSDLIEAKLCVALGAAFWGQIKDQPNSNFEFIGGANRLIHDVGYLDLLKGTVRQVFVTVFAAQTEFPCETVINLPLTKDRIVLQLAENRGKKRMVEGNSEIRRTGRVMIDAQGVAEPTLEIKFAIDENRVLQITANGESQNIELVDE